MKAIPVTDMDIYVDINAKSEGNGSCARPFRSINEAAACAGPGDTVRVAPGVYREKVDPLNSGTEDDRISYVSTEALAAVITGAAL